MTKVVIYINTNEDITGFKIEGHTGYAMIGQDIVCAAISAIAQATVIGLTEVLKLRVNMEEADGFLSCIIANRKMSDIKKGKAQAILKTMKLALEDIEKQYRNFLKVCTRQFVYSII